VALPLVLLTIWALSALASPNRYFPSPWKIGEAFGKTWLNESFAIDVLPSVGRLITGIVLAVVIGIALGLLIGSIGWLRDLLEPAFEFFRAVPPPMLVPILTLVLGISDQTKVTVIVAGSLWPILLNAIEGVRAVDSIQRETAKSYQVGLVERIRSIVLPSAMPQIMAGIRQSLSIALILMVISEMSAATSGLGYRITFFQQNFMIAEMWSGILLLGLIGILLSIVFQFAERWVLGWYRGLKGAERA